MKKILSFILILVMALSLVACGGTADSDDAPAADSNVTTEESADKDTEKDNAEVEVEANSLEALEEMVNKDVEDTIAALIKDY